MKNPRYEFDLMKKENNFRDAIYNLVGKAIEKTKYFLHSSDGDFNKDSDGMVDMLEQSEFYFNSLDNDWIIITKDKEISEDKYDKIQEILNG